MVVHEHLCSYKAENQAFAKNRQTIKNDGVSSLMFSGMKHWSLVFPSFCSISEAIFLPEEKICHYVGQHYASQNKCALSKPNFKRVRKY